MVLPCSYRCTKERTLCLYMSDDISLHLETSRTPANLLCVCHCKQLNKASGKGQKSLAKDVCGFQASIYVRGSCPILKMLRLHPYWIMQIWLINSCYSGFKVSSTCQKSFIGSREPQKDNRPAPERYNTAVFVNGEHTEARRSPCLSVAVNPSACCRSSPMKCLRFLTHDSRVSDGLAD
jgi:hypothetical protein